MLVPINPEYSLDIFINTRLKYGPAQKKLIVPLSLFLFSEGSESIVLGILIPILSAQWSMNDSQKSSLIAAVYIGAAIGSLLQTLADKYGRYKIMTISGFLQVISNIWSCFATSYQLFLILRFVFGIGLGIIAPLSVTYITEISPNNQRGLLISLSRVFWSSGMIFTALVSYIFKEQWRLILFLISLPSVAGMYYQVMIGNESPRFLLFSNRPQQAKQILNKMCQMNSAQTLTQQQYQNLKEWSITNKQNTKSQLSYSDLFKGGTLFKTLRIFYLWFAVNFIYYGGILLFPIILDADRSNKDMNYIIILVSSIFEVVLLYLARVFMDSETFGRRKTIIFGFFASALCSTLMLLDLGKLLFSFFFMMMKLFGGLSFLTLYPYTAESYHTLVRSKILGLGSILGRSGTILMGWVGIMALHSLNGKLLYLMFIAVSVLSMAAMFSLKRDTLNVHLDIPYH